MSIEERIAASAVFERECVQKYGQAVRMVGGVGGFVYTIGNSVAGRADLILDGDGSPTMGNMLNYIAECRKNGIEVVPGDNTTLYEVPVRIVKAADWVKLELATGTTRFNGGIDYDLFQVVLCDREGRFPGHPDYRYPDARFVQRNLSNEPGTPWKPY